MNHQQPVTETKQPSTVFPKTDRLKQKVCFSVFSLALILVFFTGCHSAAKLSGDAENGKAAQWYQSREWLNGLSLAPHSSINQQEFYRQYQLNNRWWDEAFAFLKSQDLAALKPGTYVIDSNNVIATVTELTPKQRDETNWEAHRNFDDLQYIITGKAVMGVAAITDPKATVKTPYDSKGDVEVFSVDNPAYYDAEPGSFFIFSPKDIHRPAFRAAGYDNIKKIVIKVRVPQGS